MTAMRDEPAGVGEPSEDVVAVAENFVRLMRSFARSRAQLIAATEHDVEWSAQQILKCLHHAGPIRSSALAECVQSDPSTVSRHVAALVKDGFVERRADPEDGRASLLVVTAKAGAVLQAYADTRNRHFARMLDGWSERDLRSFATLIDRFTGDYEAASNVFLSERAATRRRSAEGTP